MTKIFRDKVAVITGGASGIGRELGRQLGDAGARVVLSDIDEPELRDAVASIAGAVGRPADVADPDAVQQLVDGAVDQYGRLDYMFNNAGIGIAGEILDLELDDWRRIIDVNLFGVVHGVHAAYPVMASQGFGHIVNIASVAGLAATPNMAPYGTTKHAVVGLTRSLRAEAAAYGVKASCVCPGFLATRIYEHSKYINLDRQQMVDNIPFKIMPLEPAIRQILRGVARNKADIVITPHGRMIYRIQRLFPGLMARVAAREAAKARKLRTKIAGE